MNSKYLNYKSARVLLVCSAGRELGFELGQAGQYIREQEIADGNSGQF